MRLNVLNKRVAMIMVAAVAAYSWAQEPGKPVVKSQLQTIDATVESIDPATREVSLRGPEGPVSLVVGPEARNLDKVKVGDKVVVSYYQGIAAQMSKGGKKVSEPATSTFAYPAAGGEKPGGGVGGSVTTTVTIEDIDPGTNTVAFRRPDGQVRIIGVQSPEMQEFVSTLKRGDQVDVTYTESVAVNVVPASSRSAGVDQEPPTSER